MTTEPQADIVERLLRPWFTNGCEAYQHEAAAEITRLRAQVKIVQSAAKTIMIGEADELRRLREQHREWHLAIKSLDSEREANAILTAENEALRAEVARLREALGVADAAIKEMFRYYDGGETRGSYDGKPERNQLRKAGYATTAALKGTDHGRG